MPPSGRSQDFIEDFHRLTDRVRRLELRSSPAAPAANLPSFAADGSSFNTPSTPTILDNNSAGGSLAFSTTDSNVFEFSSAGRVQITQPGFYVIGCQLDVKNSTFTSQPNDTYVYMYLQYNSPTREVGYSLEIPYLISGWLAQGQGEEVIGTRYVYPQGDAGGHDVCLQRLHPISIRTTPVEIRPTFLTNWEADVRADWLALWGFRVSNDLGGWFSD